MDLLPWICVIGIALCGAALFAIQWFSAHAKIGRAWRKRIADVANGELVKIVGRIELHTPHLVDPFRGRPCAYHETIIEEHKSLAGTGRGHWRLRVTESDARAFAIEDESGKAFVEVASIEVAVVMDEHLTSWSLEDAGREVRAYVERHVNKHLLEPAALYRVTQGLLQAGEEVAVVGVARWEVDPTSTEGGGYRGGAKRLVIAAPAGAKLLASDDPKTFG